MYLHLFSCSILDFSKIYEYFYFYILWLFSLVEYIWALYARTWWKPLVHLRICTKHLVLLCLFHLSAESTGDHVAEESSNTIYHTELLWNSYDLLAECGQLLWCTWWGEGGYVCCVCSGQRTAWGSRFSPPCGPQVLNLDHQSGLTASSYPVEQSH